MSNIEDLILKYNEDPERFMDFLPDEPLTEFALTSTQAIRILDRVLDEAPIGHYGENCIRKEFYLALRETVEGERGEKNLRNIGRRKKT